MLTVSGMAVFIAALMYVKSSPCNNLSVIIYPSEYRPNYPVPESYTFNPVTSSLSV
jgi:hypothetical protein